MTLPEQETRRLVETYVLIERAAADRKATLQRHDDRTAELEAERLAAVDWKEKNRLAEELREHGHHDPRKYRPEFTQLDSPYFGILGIADADKRIGAKEYLIGKQTLMAGNRVAIVDWRTADITRLFYDYEEGEEYEETIKGIDREGVVAKKHTVTIARRTLVRIETPGDTFELNAGAWVANGARVCSADTKAAEQDHRLVDIVALISAAQFRMITKETIGCSYITGAAGSGKTTVALHRLSCLLFNQPELFRPERCLVLMFNRTLRDYVKKTSTELLGPQTRVETFNAWALAALGALGVHQLKVGLEDPHDRQKKSAQLEGLLERYAQQPAKHEPVVDLWLFYSEQYVAEALCGSSGQATAFSREYQRRLAQGERGVSFADTGILLRLQQLRRAGDAVVAGALNWYDHIVVDEAQDFGEVELRAIMAAASPQKSLTVCADEKQKILGFIDAAGFTNFRNQLHSLNLDRETLTLAYRSAKEIGALAGAISGRPVDTSQAAHGTVSWHRQADFVTAVATLGRIATKLAQVEPDGLTAVVCRTKNDARAVHQALAGVPGLHPFGELNFAPGVLVTNVHQVKGLEFTNVVLWNPSGRDYRATETDQNLLYVAITRACKRLYTVHWQDLSPLLAPHVTPAS